MTENNISSVPTKPTLSYILLSTKGRISRKVFWVHYIMINMALLSFLFIDIIAVGHLELFLLLLILSLGIFTWFIIAIEIKRFHDLNQPGAMVLVSIIPFIGLLWIFIALGCLKGTDGPNKYGPDPLAK